MSVDDADKLCGRVTDHEPHHWPGRDPWGMKVEFHCPGHVTVEGGWIAHGKVKS